jgi:hypothetical protein
MKLRKLCSVICLFLLVTVLTGCDPSTAIYKIFSDQGLTLVKPARSYIQIGGLVILPKGTNQLLYQDPWDVIAQADGPNATPPSTDFSAVIMSQSDKSASGVDFKAVLAQLVSLPLDLDLSHNTSLTLGQIQASGTRYTTPMMAALVAKPSTAQAIRDRLNEGSRVFIIQEVYTATSLSVTSGSNTSISATLGDGGSPPSCVLPDSGSGTSGATGKAGTTAATGANGAGGAATATGGATGASGALGKTGAAVANGAGGATAATEGGTGKTGVTGPTIAGIGGMSAGVCFANAATLSFTSTAPVPFAVRLNEVTLVGGTTPAIKYTGYKLPNGALPASDPEVENSIAINSLVGASTLTPIPH